MEFTFAFVIPTPDYAKAKGLGQYNGYVGIHKFFVKAKYNETWEEYEYTYPAYGLQEDISFEERGLGNYRAVLNEHPEYIMSGPIPDNDEDYFIIGFDTMHIDNKWDVDDFESVGERTIAMMELIDRNIQKMYNRIRRR